MLLVGTAVVVLIAIGAIFRMGLTRVRASLTVIAFGLALPALVMAAPTVAAESPANVGLGTAESYSVLGGQTVTNTGPSVLAGSVGLSPGPSVTGFPPGIVTSPAVIDAENQAAAQAQSDLTIAYDDAAGRPVTGTTTADLTDLNLSPGVYHGPDKSALKLHGTLVLDAEDDPDAVFIFQTDSTLTTFTGSTVELINGAQACHVFWQVGSSAILGTHSTFVGTVLALTSISVNTGATVKGRALARNGSVTLQSNTFTDASCAEPVTTTTTGSSSTTSSSTPVGPTTTTSEATTTSAPVGPTTTTSEATTTSAPVGSTTTTSEATTTSGASSTSEATTTSGASSTSTSTGMTGGTVPSSGPGTPGTTQELARTGWPTTPLVLFGGLMVTIGLATLLIGRDRNVEG